MLSCKDVATRASAHIDGELTMWEALQMRLHLAMCKGCERFIGQMRTTRALTEVPPDTGTEYDAGDDRFRSILSQLRDDKQQGS